MQTDKQTDTTSYAILVGIIDRTYPLEEMIEAHRHVDQGKKKGNITITLTH